MKKKVIVTAVISGLISGAAFAQTNVVSSANVVGYNQITVPSNQLVLVSLDFDNTNNTINGLFGTLPVGSKVSRWNTGTQQYIASTKSVGGWGTAGTNKIEKGTGVFVQLPANVQTNIYFSGDVPMSETTLVYKVNGLAVISYPYPVDTPFTNTAVAKTAKVGDKISVWNNGYTAYTRSVGGWGSGTNLQLKVGQAFFFQSTTNSTISEVKPLYNID